MHSSLVLNLISAIKKQKSVFITKWKFIPSYQCTRHCVLAPALFQLLFILPSACNCFTEITCLQWFTGSQNHFSPASVLHTPKSNPGQCSISVQAFIFFSQILHQPYTLTTFSDFVFSEDIQLLYKGFFFSTFTLQSRKRNTHNPGRTAGCQNPVWGEKKCKPHLGKINDPFITHFLKKGLLSKWYKKQNCRNAESLTKINIAIYG